MEFSVADLVAIAEAAQAHAVGPRYYLEVCDADLVELAAGSVPKLVQIMARQLAENLDTIGRRNADRPVHKLRKDGLVHLGGRPTRPRRRRKRGMR